MKRELTEMKKDYITPYTDVIEIKTGALMTASGVCSNEKDIDYGGVDENGELDPASRRYDVWDDEEEE